MHKRVTTESIVSLMPLISVIFIILFNIYILCSIKKHKIFDFNSNMPYRVWYPIWGIITLILLSVITFLLIIFNYKKMKHKDIIIARQNEELESQKGEIDRQNVELESQKKLIESVSVLYKNIMEDYKLKTEFFSSISHELKTPLTVILGAIQLIDQSKPLHFDEKRKSSKHFTAIKHNCYILLRLINNILDITKIESGYIKISFVNCNIVYLIEEITQSVAPYAKNKGITLEFDTESEEIYTAVDIDKVERIILNLLSNAIKFTPTGGLITVKVGKSENNVAISVKDTGPGIPKNMQSYVFDRFNQVNSSLTRESEGTGIGLSLVKSFVSLHKGKVELISEENKGCEFIVELPIFTCEQDELDGVYIKNCQNKIVEAINIEFSKIYSTCC